MSHTCMSSAQSENLPNLEIVLLILRLRKFSDCTEHIYSSIRERVEKMERERKGKRERGVREEGRGREKNGRWKREERRSRDARGKEEEGGRRERRTGGRKQSHCDQHALQFDSRSHDTGPSLLKYDWSITGAFAVGQATHCIWCLSISLYLFLASWS